MIVLGVILILVGYLLPVPGIIATIGWILLVIGLVLLVLGWKARWAAAALFVFVLVAALYFHAFWASPPDQAMMQQIQFMKNLAIMGGMLYVVAYGSGPYSVDKT